MKNRQQEAESAAKEAIVNFEGRLVTLWIKGYKAGFESRQPEIENLQEQLEAWKKQCLDLMDEIQSPRLNF